LNGDGISLFGTITALLGAASVAVAAVATGLVPVSRLATIILAGFFGTVVDSLLGRCLSAVAGSITIW
jgi:uncharacterized membrane protein